MKWHATESEYELTWWDDIVILDKAFDAVIDGGEINLHRFEANLIIDKTGDEQEYACDLMARKAPPDVHDVWNLLDVLSGQLSDYDEDMIGECDNFTAFKDQLIKAGHKSQEFDNFKRMLSKFEV